ncbi:unnamed protein product [Discosporangium mesarthrocarpum]
MEGPRMVPVPVPVLAVPVGRGEAGGVVGGAGRDREVASGGWGGEGLGMMPWKAELAETGPMDGLWEDSTPMQTHELFQRLGQVFLPFSVWGLEPATRIEVPVWQVHQVSKVGATANTAKNNGPFPPNWGIL